MLTIKIERKLAAIALLLLCLLLTLQVNSPHSFVLLWNSTPGYILGHAAAASLLIAAAACVYHERSK